MEKKEVYICHQQPNFEEDEIDLKELFKTIWKYRKFIAIFTGIITLLSIIYAYSIKPVYQIESFIEVGFYNNNNNNKLTSKDYFIDPNNALILIQNEFKSELLPTIDNVNFKKGTKILDIKINGYSNQEAIDYLNTIIGYLQKKESIKIDIFTKTIKEKIKNLQKYKQSIKERIKNLNSKLNPNIDSSIYQALLAQISSLNSQIFRIDNQIVDLQSKISPLNISKIHIIGKILKSKYPIKPKKKLIVIVAFITSFILSIFIIFFIEFFKEDNLTSNS